MVGKSQHVHAFGSDDEPGGNTPPDRKPAAPVLRFIVTFLVCLAGGGALYAFLSTSFHSVLKWLMRVTALIAGGAVALFSNSAGYQDQMCSFRGFQVQIIDECTGVLEIVIYTAAVLAYPTTWRKKLWGILLGAPAIYTFNVIRIIVLLIVGAYSQKVFDFLHLYFWQVTLIIIIATIWVAWLLLVVHRDRKGMAVSC